MLLIILPLYLLYIWVGFFYIDKEFEDVLFLSIFFLIGLLLFSFILSLFLSQQIKIRIIDYKRGKDGAPNMTRVGRGRIYTFTYILNSIEYIETIFYSSMTRCNIGDVKIAYKCDKLIVIQGDLFKLLYFAIFPITFTLIMLVI